MPRPTRPSRTRQSAAPPPAAALTPPPASPTADPDARYRPTALDVAALSAQLGPATEADVRLLVEGSSDPELVELGNDFATPRATADALRIFGVAASFLQTAPAADRAAVPLELEVVRFGAWAAAEQTAAAGAIAEARQTLADARVARGQLADSIRSVAQSRAVDVAVTHALAPKAHGADSPGPEVSLELLVKQGRALLDSNTPSVQRRAGLFQLTAARLDNALVLAKAAKKAVAVINAPKTVVTQQKVDWWDGATYTILQTVVRAFQGARATRAGVPRVEFVSLRHRTKPGADDEGGGGGPNSGGGGPNGGGGGSKGGGGDPEGAGGTP